MVYRLVCVIDEDCVMEKNSRVSSWKLLSCEYDDFHVAGNF